MQFFREGCKVDENGWEAEGSRFVPGTDLRAMGGVRDACFGIKPANQA